ncbi:hypothetical protein [Streptomyces sp. DB-54]
MGWKQALAITVTASGVVVPVMKELIQRFLSRKKTLDDSVKQVMRSTGVDVSPRPKDRPNG